MFFTHEQIEDLARGVQQMRRDYAGFRQRLVRMPLQTAGGREQADHGFGRRLTAASPDGRPLTAALTMRRGQKVCFLRSKHALR